MTDRLCENMLELIKDSQEQDSNSTLCNLNYKKYKRIELQILIVIVHYVI